MFNTKSIMTEIYKEFPDVEEEALDKICNTGMSRILKLIKSSEELIITLKDQREVKFGYPCTPEKQFKLTQKNIHKRARMAARKNQDGQASK